MKLASLNIKGGAREEKMAEVILWARNNKVDLLFLCESHLTKERVAHFETRWDNVGWFTNAPCSNTKGVTFLTLNNTLVPRQNVTVEYKDRDGQILKVKVRMDGADSIIVTGLYAPNLETEKMDFFHKMWALEGDKRSDIILGDFNMCEDALDRNPSREDPPRVVEAFHQMRQGRLFDQWRIVNPDKREFTFWSSNKLQSASRLDKILTTTKIARKCIKWEIILTPGWSDHAAVSVEYYPLDKTSLGKGQWNLSTSLLTRGKMDGIIQKHIGNLSKSISNAETVSSQGETPQASAHQILHHYDSFLNAVRADAKTLQKEEGLRANKLETRLISKIKKYDREDRCKKMARRIKRYRYRLQALYEVKEKRRALCAKHKWLEMGACCGRDFWQMGASSQTATTVQGLMNEEGKVQKNTKEILRVGQSYYQSLYSRRETDDDAQQCLLNHVSTQKMDALKAPLSSTEVLNVIQKWENGKTPGPDGIPYEFFKHVSTMENVKQLFVEATTNVIAILLDPLRYGQRMPRNWAEGTIKIMYKKGDKTDIKNYRPLSMTNSIYKLFTTVVNNRMLPEFNKHIGQHQVGFMPNRTYFDHTKHMQTLVDHARMKKKTLYVALLDQEKAYDRVDHQFLWKTLRKFGVPESLNMAIQGCYTSASSRVMINKMGSDPIQIESGVRQGDPLSCLLFNVVIETLALEILTATSIGYIDDTGRRHVIDMYADDTGMCLSGLPEWKECKRRYDIYARATGAKLNEGKTKLLVAYDPSDPPHRYKGIEVVKNEKYLGIPIGTEVDYPAFWQKVHDKIVVRITGWKMKHLSIRQRVAVANTMLISLLWYYIRSVPIRQKDIDMFERTTLEYVWGVEPGQKLQGPIKNSHIYRPIETGGLGLLKVGLMWKSLGLYWIHRCKMSYRTMESQQPLWYPLMCSILTENVHPEVKPMITRPWEQTWEARPKKPPPSLHHFMRHWSTHEACPPVDTLGNLARIEFWFHPLLNKVRTTQRWCAPVWQDLFYGNTQRQGIRTIGDIWDVAKGITRSNANCVGAARRLLENMPIEWKTLMTGMRPWDAYHQERIQNGDVDGELTMIPHVSTRAYVTAGPEMTNRNVYNHLRMDVDGPENLLDYLTQICRRDGYPIETHSEAAIWKSLNQKKTDYPKFADLYWKLVMCKVRTGESWMEKADCPRCKVRQTQEHLFWSCPIAKLVWTDLQKTWSKLTDEDVKFPQTWAELLVSGLTHSRGSFKPKASKRRWRILFSEAMWSLWTHRCAWSFDEIPTFEGSHVVARYRSRIESRWQVDRLLAQGERKADKRLTLNETWGQDLANNNVGISTLAK